MKVLSTIGLTKLIQLIKSSFISVDDVVETETIETVDAETIELANVATSGDYNDLVNKPTNVSDFTNDAGYQTAQQVNDAISSHNTSDESHSDIRGDIQTLDNKIEEIKLFKFPNAIIVGSPTINNGQISGFSSENYLMLPFLFDVGDRAFELNFHFMTGSNITTAQNLIGSSYCLASYISNGKLYVRASGNGTSWNVLDIETSLNVQPNSVYFIRIAFNRLNYTISASTDGETYTQIGYKVTTEKPIAGQLFIGVGNGLNNPFLGIINLNKWYLKLNNSIIWEGMDDAGLATRADISLSNLDGAGEKRFDDKQDVLVSGTNIKTINGTSVLGDGNLEIEGKSNLSELNDVSISSPANGQFLSYNGAKWTNTTLNALQNTATRDSSLTILGTPTTKYESVNIGKNSNVNSGGTGNVAIGYGSIVQSNASYATAIGRYAKAQADGSIALGNGCRTTIPNTFCVAVGGWNETSYMMMDSYGKIPEDRITKQTTLSSSSTDNQVPSAKCVYDLVGNIESLLATI